jgi:hypothetical protein
VAWSEELLRSSFEVPKVLDAHAKAISVSWQLSGSGVPRREKASNLRRSIRGNIVRLVALPICHGVL